MLADRVRIGTYGTMSKMEIPEGYVLATDSDFSGTTNGSFKYIGTDEHIVIPNRIKGVAVTTYSSMFDGYTGTQLKGVASFNKNITSISYMFFGSQATSLDLSNFNTSNVTSMSYMFRDSKATTLDLSNFDTSNVTGMIYMFSNSQATSLDLSSFNTSKVTNMNNMFNGSKATTGYARTQTDADKFNAISGKPAGLVFTVKP